MEWKDYSADGVVYWSTAHIGVFDVSLSRKQGRWVMESFPIARGRILASDKLDEAKCQAQAAVQVALEEALAALVGEETSEVRP